VLTLSWDGAGRWIDGGGGLPVGGPGGGAVRCREGCGGSVGEVWDGEGVVLALYRRLKAVRGGRFFCGEVAGEAVLGAGRARSPGDGMARAGAEVVGQPLGLFKHAAQGDGMGRPGRGGSRRRRRLGVREGSCRGPCSSGWVW
jgi:hypothetical protein